MDGAFPSKHGEGFEGGQAETGQTYHGAQGGLEPPRRTGFRGTAENAKTKICKRWQAGHCHFAERCNFAHGEHELRALPSRYPGEHGGRGGGRNRGGYDGGYGGRGPGGYDGGFNGGYGSRGDPGFGAPYGAGPYPDPGFDGRGPGPEAMGGPMMGDPMGGMGVPGGELSRGPPRNMPPEVWAANGYPVQGANGWVQYRTPDGEYYYHSHTTMVTVWDEPPEFHG